jgi:cytochrome bd-type quinol oxidase subunit 2
VPTGIELDFLFWRETVDVAAAAGGGVAASLDLAVVAGTYLAGFPIDAANRLGSLAASSSVTGRGFHTFLGLLDDDDDGVYVSDIIVIWFECDVM